MPVLASLLVSMFTALLNMFATWLTKKVAIGLAAVTTFAALTLALWTAIGLALNGISAVSGYDSGVAIGLWVAFSTNGQMVLSATVAADTAIALYRWNSENLKLMAYIT